MRSLLGGIVVEEALIRALREKMDCRRGHRCFVQEPAHEGNYVPVKEGREVPNLVMGPHVAWYARSSIEKLRRTVEANEAWYEGNS